MSGMPGMQSCVHQLIDRAHNFLVIQQDLKKRIAIVGKIRFPSSALANSLIGQVDGFVDDFFDREAESPIQIQSTLVVRRHLQIDSLDACTSKTLK